MLSPKLRILLIIIFISFGIITLFTDVSLYIPFAFGLTACILLLGHFRHGPILGVLSSLRTGNINQAENLLASIKRPEWLSPRFLTYYYFANSLVASHRQDVEMAGVHSQKALDLGYLQPKEQIILLYNLARVAYEKKDYVESNQKLQQLLQLPIDDLQIKQRAEELELALKKIMN